MLGARCYRPDMKTAWLTIALAILPTAVGAMADVTVRSGRLRAETRDDESANNLRQVIQGLLALGRMTNDQKAIALLNSLQLSGSGKTVSLSFAVPSEVIDMIPQIKKDGANQLHELPRQLHQR